MDERDWQSIETAPKDGTVIDIWVVRLEYGTTEHFDGRRHTDASWGQVRGYEGGDAWTVYDGSGRWEDVAPAPQYRATHWMPLPNPPSKDTP